MSHHLFFFQHKLDYLDLTWPSLHKIDSEPAADLEIHLVFRNENADDLRRKYVVVAAMGNSAEKDAKDWPLDYVILGRWRGISLILYCMIHHFNSCSSRFIPYPCYLLLAVSSLPCTLYNETLLLGSKIFHFFMPVCRAVQRPVHPLQSVGAQAPGGPGWGPLAWLFWTGTPFM